MASLQEIIRKHALKNASDFGKANPGSVAGKAIAEFPDAKKDMKATMKAIGEAVAAVNAMDRAAMEKELSKYEFAEKKHEERKGFDIPGAVQGKVVTRFPPEPSGYPHIGHAKAAFLDYELAKQYGGKMILRFDDTNPEKESKEYADAIKSGLKWLGIEWAEETYTSDNMAEIYKAAETLIDKNRAYVCMCPKEAAGLARQTGRPCKCWNFNEKWNMDKWKDMLAGRFAPGAAVLLYKGDLQSKNTVMRDPALARIITAPHYRQKKKYVVWPSYDLAVAVMDHMEGITHPMRSKEYELRDELYADLFFVLEWKKPSMVPFSRLDIRNAPISKRLLKPLVEEGKVAGWDDPRLPTLDGLKRRGILPAAIRNFVMSFGLSKVESEPTWEALLAENRKLLDPVAPRYFFVEDPVELRIEGAKPEKAKLRLHPKSDMGYREMKVKGTVYVSKGDYAGVGKGDVFRLKDLYNVAVVGGDGPHTVRFAGNELVEKKFQWVSDEKIECEVLVPGDLLKADGEYDPGSMRVARGVCESNCAKLKVGDMLQFERFGFVRLDAKAKDKLTFVYSC